MAYLILAIVCSSMVSLSLRLSEGKTQGTLGKLCVNYIACTLLSALAVVREGAGGTGMPLAMGLGAFNGGLYLLGLVMMHRSIRLNGVILSATFMKLGLLVPLVLSFLLFGERPAPLQYLGLGLSLFAIVFINYGKGQGALTSKRDLLALLVLDGLGSAMSKIFKEWGVPSREGLFLLCTFGMAMLLCFCLMRYKKEAFCKQDILYGLLLGLPNYYSSKLLLRALAKLPAVVVYPSYSVGSMLLVALSGLLFFRERLSKRQTLALLIILLALALLNL